MASVFAAGVVIGGGISLLWNTLGLNTKKNKEKETKEKNKKNF